MYHSSLHPHFGLSSLVALYKTKRPDSLHAGELVAAAFPSMVESSEFGGGRLNTLGQSGSCVASMYGNRDRWTNETHHRLINLSTKTHCCHYCLIHLVMGVWAKRCHCTLPPPPPDPVGECAPHSAFHQRTFSRSWIFQTSWLAPVTNGFQPQSTFISRVQSSVWRLPNYWPPPPLHPASVSSPRTKGGGYTLAERWRCGGSIFRKTPDIGLASCSIIPLRVQLLNQRFTYIATKLEKVPNLSKFTLKRGSNCSEPLWQYTAYISVSNQNNHSYKWCSNTS